MQHVFAGVETGVRLERIEPDGEGSDFATGPGVSMNLS